jgi:hypothetical protein
VSIVHTLNSHERLADSTSTSPRIMFVSWRWTRVTFRAPLCPCSNYLTPARFALMFFAPGFRTGVYAFPAGLIGLFMMPLAHRKYTGAGWRRRPSRQPLGSDKT